MKHLEIRILEFVRAQQGHKLPVVFTLGKNPLPDCSESPEEVLQDVHRLKKEGIIEAFEIMDVTGKPSREEIHYVTLKGIVWLEKNHSGIKPAGIDSSAAPCRDRRSSCIDLQIIQKAR